MKKTAKYFLGKLLYCFYSICNLLPKNNDVLFISYPDASDNSWFLYSNILKSTYNKKIVWLVSNHDKNTIDKITSESSAYDHTVSIIKRWSIKGIYHFSRSKVVFHTHGTYYFIRKSFSEPTIINLWHGMPIKKLGLLDNKSLNDISYSHYSLSTSQFYKKIISESLNIPYNKVLNIGLPRNDVFQQKIPKYKQLHILKSLQITEHEKIIIWLPTYRQSSVGDIRKDSSNNSFLSELPGFFLKELDHELSKFNARIIIKLHPMDILNLQKIQDELTNIKIISAQEWAKLNIELYELLSISHALISDVSSVIVDYISHNKPIGIFNNVHEYSRGIIEGTEELLATTYNLKTIKDITDLLSMTPHHSLQKFNENFIDLASDRIIMNFLK